MNRLVCLLLVLGIACWLPAGVLAQDDTSTTAPPANETSAVPASDPETSGKTEDVAGDGVASEGVASESEPGILEWVETEGIETLLVTLLVLTPFAAFALGRIFTIKVFRAKDLSGHFGLICFSIVAPAVVIFSNYNYKDGELQLNWGVDLRGGVILVYEVEDKKKQDSSVMQAMVQTLGNRLNKSGLKEIVVRPYGDRQVEIIIPEADDIEISRIKKQITTAGVLEFHIVASERDHADVVAQARLNAQAEGPQRRERLVREGGVDDGLVIGKWVRLMDPSEWGDRDIVRDERTGTILDARSGLNQLLPDYERRLEQARQRQTEQGGGSLRVPLGAEILMAVAEPDEQVLGEHLDVVRADFDEQMNDCISFGMNQLGADRMGLLTANNLPTNDFYRRLGIVMDRDLESAPRIMSTIRDQGRITGSFSKEDVELIVGVLQSGRLQTTLQENPISEDKIGATLGDDTIRRGRTAIGGSLALVLLFIVLYYRFAGVVACLALLLNLLLILALMILLKAAVTLPGLAGLVLTVGMSVDANVLIFERIREELKKGAALRLAIRNGFARATTTIVDANVTTLITAIILYAIGTDQVRGFAVTLILGIMMSMYTAIFCSRVVFNLWERKRYLTKLSMLEILGATQIDFIGKRSLAAAFSLLVIVVGLGAVADRRSAIFDIDFLGGTSVTMYLDKTAGKYDESDSVRSIVGEVLGKVEVRGAKVGYSLSKVEMEDEPDKVAWKLDTSIPSESVKQTADNGAATLLVPFAEGDRPSGNANVVDGVSFLKQQLQEAAGFGGGENGQSAFVHYQVTVDESTFEEVPQESSEGAPQAPAAEPATADQQNPANPQPAEPAAADDTEAPAPGNEDGARWEQPQQRIASLRRQGFVVAQEETPPAAAADETAPTVDASATDPAAAATDAEQPVTGPASAAGKVDTVGILEFQEKYPINGITLKQELSDAAADAGIPLEVDDDELLDEGNIHVAKAAADSRDVDPNWLASDPSPQLRWRVTLVGLPRDKALTVVRQLKKSFAEEPIWLSSSTIGGRVAGDMRATAVAALFASLLGIVGYLWIRFQRVIYGLAAVVALLHDVLITLGAIALSAYMADYLGWLMIEEFKISLPMVAAFLTIVGYSLNDTIVVFDRIREVRGKSPSITDVMINTSINQTLRRTLLTSLTTLIVVVILYAFGGAGIHGFAFALVVGVIVGTYSSIFVASPALLWMARRAVARGDTV